MADVESVGEAIVVDNNSTDGTAALAIEGARGSSLNLSIKYHVRVIKARVARPGNILFSLMQIHRYLHHYSTTHWRHWMVEWYAAAVYVSP